MWFVSKASGSNFMSLSTNPLSLVCFLCPHNSLFNHWMLRACFFNCLHRHAQTPHSLMIPPMYFFIKKTVFDIGKLGTYDMENSRTIHLCQRHIRSLVVVEFFCSNYYCYDSNGNFPHNPFVSKTYKKSNCSKVLLFKLLWLRFK